MKYASKPIRTALGYSMADRVVVRGMDLSNDILGHMNLGDMAFLVLCARKPDAQESVLFNAIVVTLVEHGITPSALAARLTYTGAPESLQAAVAAGLCGLGSVFVGSMENAARLLADTLAEHSGATDDAALQALACQVVAAHAAQRRLIPGVGHPVHVPLDPRAQRLLALAEQCGKNGPYVRLMQAIQHEAQARHGRPLPLNATGVIGAICCEFGFPWQMVRGIGVMARAIGLVGHIMEEAQDPIGMTLWARADQEALQTALIPDGPG